MESVSELIETGRQWLEHAPPADSKNPELVGFTGRIEVCSRCAARIIARGCNLRRLADMPVWRPEELSCYLCGQHSS